MLNCTVFFEHLCCLVFLIFCCRTALNLQPIQHICDGVLLSVLTVEMLVIWGIFASFLKYGVYFCYELLSFIIDRYSDSFNKNLNKHIVDNFNIYPLDFNKKIDRNFNKIFNNLHDKLDSPIFFILAYSYVSRVINSLKIDCNSELTSHKKVKLHDQRIYIEIYKNTPVMFFNISVILCNELHKVFNTSWILYQINEACLSKSCYFTKFKKLIHCLSQMCLKYVLYYHLVFIIFIAGRNVDNYIYQTGLKAYSGEFYSTKVNKNFTFLSNVYKRLHDMIICHLAKNNFVINILIYIKTIDNKLLYLKNFPSENLYFTYLLKICILGIYILGADSVKIYTSYHLKTSIKNRNIFFKICLGNKCLAGWNFVFAISIYLFNVNDTNTIIDTKIYFLNYTHYNFVLEHINSLTKNKLCLFTKNLSSCCPHVNFNCLCLTDKYCENDFLICESYIFMSTTKYFTSIKKFKIQLNIVILNLFKHKTSHLYTSFLCFILYISLFALHFLYFICCTHQSIINYILIV